MIYIPTLTSKLRKDTQQEYDNILYSPNLKCHKIIVAKNITIWDNYTFYLMKRLISKQKYKITNEHFIWLINFIIHNYQEGVTLITPDVDWLPNGIEIEKQWIKYCSKYPQLYVPNTWTTNTEKLNIVGYALRKNSINFHPYWNHCLAHKRNIECELLTYDATREISCN